MKKANVPLHTGSKFLPNTASRRSRRMTGWMILTVVKDAVPEIAAFLDSPVPILRERAINAMGRIGRGDYDLVEPYWKDMFRFANDEDAKVRLSFS